MRLTRLGTTGRDVKGRWSKLPRKQTTSVHAQTGLRSPTESGDSLKGKKKWRQSTFSEHDTYVPGICCHNETTMEQEPRHLFFMKSPVVFWRCRTDTVLTQTDIRTGRTTSRVHVCQPIRKEHSQWPRPCPKWTACGPHLMFPPQWGVVPLGHK